MVISSQEEVVNYSMKEGSVPGYIWDIFFFMEEREELSLAVILLNREPYWGLPGPWLLWPCLKGPCTIIHLPSPTVYNKSLLEHCTGTSTTLLNMLYITLTY